MKGHHANIGSAQATLDETPKVLDSIGVNMPAHILKSVIDYLMNIIRIQSFIGWQRIGHYFCAKFDMLSNLSLQGFSVSIFYNLSSDFASAFKYAHHNGFADWPASLNLRRSLALVHVASFAAY